MRILISRTHGRSSEPPLHKAQYAELLLTKQEFLTPAAETPESIEKWYHEGQKHSTCDDFLMREKMESVSTWFIDIQEPDDLLPITMYFSPVLLDETGYFEAPLRITLSY